MLLPLVVNMKEYKLLLEKARHEWNFLDPIFCPKGHVEPEAIGRIMIWSQGLRDFA